MKDRNGDKFIDESGFYKLQSKQEIRGEVDALIDLWFSFLNAQGEDALELDKDYFIHKRNLYEVIKRLDKRKTYYFVFHHLIDICEYKRLGILAYWINTLKPFMVVNSDSSVYNSPNEMFSLYIIVSALAEIYKKKYPDKAFCLPDNNTIQDYVYNFKYCGLSREAMIFFVETFAKSYGIGMETNMTRDVRA